MLSARPKPVATPLLWHMGGTPRANSAMGLSEHIALSAGQSVYFWFQVSSTDLTNAEKVEATAILTKISGQSEAHVYKPSAQSGTIPGAWSTVRSGSEIIAMQKDCGGLLGCTTINAEGKYVVRVTGGSLSVND